MAKPDTWMPLKIEPWTKKTARLSLAERGAYMDLLLAYWVGGPLPADDEDTLKRMARCTDKEWKQVRVKVLSFFTRDGDVLRQGRADEELADAAARYERRASAGRSGGLAKAKQPPKQNPSNATAKPQASYKEHSSRDETDANASVAPTKSKPRRTRLASDWKPNSDSYAKAREHGLEHSEIAADIADFIAYWTGPEPTKPLKADWDRTYDNHIRDYASKIIARRTRRGQPQRNGSGDGSVFAALSQNLEAGDLGGQDDDSRMGRGVDEDRMGDGFAGSGSTDSPENGATIIDADDWRRVPEGAGETAVHDESPQREHGRYPADVDVLRGRVA